MRSTNSNAVATATLLISARMMPLWMRVLVTALCLSLLGGCGGPSSQKIEEAVRNHCEKYGVKNSLITLPTGMALAAVADQRVAFTQIRVVKRGKPYTSWVGRKVWPVRRPSQRDGHVLMH